MLKDVSNVEQGFLVISIHNTLLSLSNKHNHQLHKIASMASFIEVIIEPTKVFCLHYNSTRGITNSLAGAL